MGGENIQEDYLELYWRINIQRAPCKHCRQSALFVLHNCNCWVTGRVSAIASGSDDNLFQWLSTQHHYLPLQLDVTLFETAWNHIYLLKQAINVRGWHSQKMDSRRERAPISPRRAERLKKNEGSSPAWGDERKKDEKCLIEGEKHTVVFHENIINDQYPSDDSCLDTVNIRSVLLYSLKPFSLEALQRHHYVFMLEW